MRVHTLASIVLGLLCLAGSGCSAQHVHVSGTATADKPYVHEIGRGFVLVVSVNKIGVQAVPYKDSGYNFADCVNEPVRGPMNPIQFDASDFGPEGEKNTAGRTRAFQFVLNARDNAFACADLDRELHRPDEQPPTGAEARWARVRYGSGKLHVTAVRLGPGQVQGYSVIESLRFDADLDITPAKSKL